MMFEKPPLEVLVHFGVKGMRWGQHKSRSAATSRSPEETLRRDARIRVAKRLAVVAGIYVAGVLVQHGDDLLVNALQNASTRQGASTVAQIMSTAAKTPYVKSKNGVFNITTM